MNTSTRRVEELDSVRNRVALTVECRILERREGVEQAGAGCQASVNEDIRRNIPKLLQACPSIHPRKVRVFEHELAALPLSTSFGNFVGLESEIKFYNYLVNTVKEELGRPKDGVNELTGVFFVVD